MRFRTKGQAVMQVKDVNVHFFSYFYLKMINRLEASFCFRVQFCQRWPHKLFALQLRGVLTLIGTNLSKLVSVVAFEVCILPLRARRVWPRVVCSVDLWKKSCIKLLE